MKTAYPRLPKELRKLVAQARRNTVGSLASQKAYKRDFRKRIAKIAKKKGWGFFYKRHHWQLSLGKMEFMPEKSKDGNYGIAVYDNIIFPPGIYIVYNKRMYVLSDVA